MHLLYSSVGVVEYQDKCLAVLVHKPTITHQCEVLGFTGLTGSQVYIIHLKPFVEQAV